MREGPGDKLVEEADHPAQLPLAALLAVAHGSDSQHWGGTQPQSRHKAPSSPECCPGQDRAFVSCSEPAGHRRQEKPYGEGSAARQPPGPACRQAGRQAGGKFFAGMIPGGAAESRAATSLQALGDRSSPLAAGHSVRCWCEPPVLCQPTARSVQRSTECCRGVLGVKEPSSASQLARTAGWMQSPGLPLAAGPPLGTSRPGTSRPSWLGTRGRLVWQPADSTGPADQ